MKVSLAVVDEFAHELVEAVTNDPKILRKGPFQGYSILSYYADSMVLTTTSGYNDHEAAAQCNLKIPTRDVLTRIVEGTWLHHRSDQPGVPNAATISFEPGQTDMLVHYYTGEEALPWVVTDGNRQQIREKLRPESIQPPTNLE